MSHDSESNVAPAPAEPIGVGVLGATGTVGLTLVRLLRGHPWFRLEELAASPESAGQAYGDALGAESRDGLSDEVLGLELRSPAAEWSSPLILSALPSGVAGRLEEDLARGGHVIVSNASSHRLDPDVPLIIPEVNPGHLALLECQRRRWPGALVTNPNCSAIGLTLPLAPLHERFGLRRVIVSTLQSLSGAGRPGPSAGAILDNVIPHVAGEESKLSGEPLKILGRIAEDHVEDAGFTVSAHTHRVPVLHGHLLAISVELESPADVGDVADAFTSFRGHIAEDDLPSAPSRCLEVLTDEARPQPRLDRDRAGGMTVAVGRIRECEVLSVKFVALVHNLVRGAAGAALLNAELCHTRGVTPRAPAV